MTFGIFAWQAGWVFALRSLQLWAEPAKTQAALAEMAIEKGRAFADGWFAASRAALRGAEAAAITAAALGPARRRVAANHRALTRPAPSARRPRSGGR
jgi:hypothetical protein